MAVQLAEVFLLSRGERALAREERCRDERDRVAGSDGQRGAPEKAREAGAPAANATAAPTPETGEDEPRSEEREHDERRERRDVDGAAGRRRPRVAAMHFAP
jgi:hypothetical protein